MAAVDRGVSTVLGYSLNLVVATLLVVGLLGAAVTLVDSQHDRAARAELDVIGERFAADVETADRLTRSADGGSVSVVSRLPSRIAGSTYDVAVVSESSAARVELSLDGNEETVVVPINNETTIEEFRRSGGTLRIRTTGDGTLEVVDG